MGGLFYSLFSFAALFGLSKLVEKDKLAFWLAGILYALAEVVFSVAPRFIAQVMAQTQPDNALLEIVSQWPHLLLIAAVASVIFWLLNRYTDTIAAWMVTFVAGYVLLVFVL